MRAPNLPELRRGVLAVCVLSDLDLEPAADGVLLTGVPPVTVSWTQLRRALAGHDPEQATGRARLTDWLLARRWCADAGREAVELALRPVGLPLDHVTHPGLDWVQERVMGDALDLGLGAVGLDPADRDRVVLLPASVVDAIGIDSDVVWQRVRADLERLGGLAAERARQDPKGVLRPFGDCDAVTLLGARSLRAALAQQDNGLGAAVVPMLRRGWTRLAHIDPAFGPAAAAATPAEQRGFARPLLLTADELTLVPEGGRPERIVLRDRVVDAPWDRDVLYR
ncbi:MAG: hypothetical protein M4D85_06850 [Actinomycetota bacterium]|nr:hypothetical protein [Actinomycetota bacterium]